MTTTTFLPPQEIEFEEKYMKTYATKDNLRKAISKFDQRLRYVIIKTETNRYAALFTNSAPLGLIGPLIHKGFTVIG